VRSGALPFKAERRHQYWSADIRYIEEHLLPDPKQVYVITIFENFSRMVLSSAISATQTQWDFVVCRISIRFFLPITFRRTVLEQPVEQINTMRHRMSPAR
jgi:hypothetical protein